jgi:hypothetical protein
MLLRIVPAIVATFLWQTSAQLAGKNGASSVSMDLAGKRGASSMRMELAV